MQSDTTAASDFPLLSDDAVSEDESVFFDAEPDAFDARMEKRAEAPKAAADDDEGDEDEPDDSEWSDQPSVADQLRRFPSSVKLDAPETEILNLSEPEDLKRYNALQKEAHPGKFAARVISHQETKFHEGAWHTLVTHQKLLYQKLM